MSAYSGWATTSITDTNDDRLAVHGIFFDEIPGEYSDKSAEYLKTINQAVKNATGLSPEKVIIHNPGAIPDARFSDPCTDLTIVFEGSYLDYQPLQLALESLSDHRSKHCYVIHSMPADMSEASLTTFVEGLSLHAEFLFTTDLNESYYESFGPNLLDFVAAVPS